MSWHPLEGVIVVDLGQLTPGCYSTLLLAELGARVIKVERPGGDPVRQLIPGSHEWLNRGKESVVLDLKAEKGRTALHDLVSVGDVVVENFREEAANRLGVTYAAIRRANPRCSLVSLRADSRHPHKPGHDLTVQAESGLLSFHHSDAGTAPRLATLDLAAATVTVVACVGAALRAVTTGEGSHVVVGMQDVGASWLGRYAAEANALGIGELAGGPRGARALQERAAYGTFRTRDDRQVAIACIEPHYWFRLVDAIADRNLVAYRNPEKRDGAVADVNRLLARIVAAQDLSRWLEIGRSKRLPIAQVRSLPSLDEIPATLFSTGSRSPGAELSPAPALGQDTDGVLQWLAARRSGAASAALDDQSQGNGR
ncbi:hypothetical protein CFI00_17210 [Nocardioides sp. S5]|uniref:CaiB/BaiF CoA transferase family protein n=1 Tax=Nocardioides sp. S5 TaxID=2017486 RepID=UPI001AF6434B|nr:CaiB/BaiF CoA-transferase family protein [Nocardioides sp. S5]QSR32202.1 hypothetical protein CFI00_17210 [Nocardioides sp. S5]